MMRLPVTYVSQSFGEDVWINELYNAFLSINNQNSPIENIKDISDIVAKRTSTYFYKPQYFWNICEYVAMSMFNVFNV